MLLTSHPRLSGQGDVALKRSIAGGGQMANLTETGATESNSEARKKKKAAAKTGKLKSSAWYQGAVRSIGITRERLYENRDELENQAAASRGSRNDKTQRSLDLHRVDKGDRQ